MKRASARHSLARAPRGWAVGLDMGGTNIRCAAVSVAGKVLLMRHGPSHASRAAPEVADNIAAQLNALLDSARRDGRAALASLWRGAARGHRDVVLLTLGTGVGGGLIVGGNLVHGRSGMAGELGHVTVEPDGPRCDCGAHGCLESYASASGLRGLVEKRLGLRAGAKLPADLVDSENNFSVRRLTALARRGDSMALEAFGVAGHYLGIAIASFLNIFNPDLVVIGGGVAGALPYMRKPMLAQVRIRAFAAVARQVKIVRAALGAHGGVVGAAYAALNPVPGRRSDGVRL